MKSASTNKINSSIYRKRKKDFKTLNINDQSDCKNKDEDEKDDIPEEFIIINCFDIDNNDHKAPPPIDPNHVFNETIVSSVPEITIVPRQDNDIMVLIGSDGLYDFFPNQKIGNFLYKLYKKIDTVNKESLIRICELLCKKSKDKGSSDDITSVLISLKQK